MEGLTIRLARKRDAAAIADIYNHYVRTSTATFDTQERSVDDQLAWIAEHTDPHPALVAESGGQIIAWGSLSPWGTRCAYRHTVEISAYLAPDYTGRGIGRLLTELLIDRARDLGHHAVISQIVHENEASLRMGQGLGFEQVGVLREVGRKFDRWLDVVIMELVLDGDDADDTESAAEALL
jgi:L-amino acid N-acyltransferase